MKCPRCQHENRTGRKFCSECGVSLALACPSCGFTNEPGEKFCGGCGASLLTPSTPRFAAPESYTPKHLAEKILTSKAALEGERKQVTVLFADLKGSMELLADRDPEEARKLLDPVLERMMDAVHRYEGTVNQVMGDGIMALFGAPLAHEDHAVRACYAALRMQDAICRYAEELRRSHGIEVEIRVGLNSGDVVVRTIGNDLRMDYTAVGQTTHLAARMEQLARAGTIRLTAETLRLAEGFVQAGPLGPIPVKGVAEPVEVFELVGAAAMRTRLQAARARGFSRFVGRDAEMDQLRQAAEQARHGRGQVVVVVGEPGVGKSRLFYEFIHSHHTHDWLVLEASSVSYGKATPFLPLTDLLRGYFRIDGRDDTRTVRAKVTGTMLTLDRALEDALPAILWLFEALGPEDAFLTVEPARRRQRAIDATKRLLLRESMVQPLLLVFEDLHWVDAETQGFLDAFVESLPTAPVLLSANYRPEYGHGWGSKTYYRQLRIDPLVPESADELLQALLGGDASVQPLKPLLIARTEGNPLFLEESVRTLVETRGLVGEPGAYRLARPIKAIQMPATVQTILAARIDRLRPELKRLLQTASVVGKDVPVMLLESIAELDAEELRQGLSELQAAEFLYETRLFPDLEYTFKHALTHEAVYGSLLGARRRQLHAAIVSALERLHGGRLGDQVELLAHHATRGEVDGKAVRYLRQAGMKAMARSANREAVTHFEQALARLAQLPQTTETLTEALDTRIALGSVLALMGGAAPEVEASYLRAQELVDRLEDESRRFPVLWGLWYASYSNGRYPVAQDAAERLLEATRRGEDTGQLLQAHHAVWATAMAMGRPTTAVEHTERGVALYDRDRHASHAFVYANHDPGACCRYQMAFNRWLLGQPDRALVSAQDAQRLAADLKHAPTMATTLWFTAWVHHLRGDDDATAAAADRLMSLAGEQGLATWTDAAMVLSLAARRETLAADALDALHRRLLTTSGATWRYVLCLSALSQLYVGAGHAEEGLRALASIPEHVRGTIVAPELQRIEGELLLRRAQPATDEAERCFRRAIEQSHRRSEKSLELRATISLGRLLRRQGKRDDAHQMLAEVYGWFTEGFDTTDLKTARALLDELSSAST